MATEETKVASQEKPATQTNIDTKTTEGTATGTTTATVAAAPAAETTTAAAAAPAPQAAAVAQAPAALFAKPEVKDVDSNPTRVAMIKAAIAAYSEKCGRALADVDARRTLSMDLMRGVRLMSTLSFADFTAVANFLVETITNNSNEAFHPRYLLMFADELAGREKDRFMLPMTAFTQYARLKNKTMLRQRVDVSAVAASMQSEGAKKAVDAFFPK